MNSEGSVQDKPHGEWLHNMLVFLGNEDVFTRHDVLFTTWNLNMFDLKLFLVYQILA